MVISAVHFANRKLPCSLTAANPELTGHIMRTFKQMIPSAAAELPGITQYAAIIKQQCYVCYVMTTPYGPSDPAARAIPAKK